MPYSSLEQIKDDLLITDNDVNSILKQLKKIRNESHPDKTNGEFPNEIVQSNFLKASDGINYIENIHGANQLLVVEQVTELVKAVKEIIPGNRQEEARNRLETTIDYQIAHYRSTFTIPKFTLTGITAVLTFITVFPQQLEANPALKGKINFQDPQFFSIWLILILVTGSIWLSTYFEEDRARQRLTLLKVESYQNILFRRFIEGSSEVFSKDELTHFIFNRGKFPVRHEVLYVPTLFNNVKIPMETAQVVADALISRGERNGVLTRNKSSSLSELYSIKPGVDF
jgi:hypothetical protein